MFSTHAGKGYLIADVAVPISQYPALVAEARRELEKAIQKETAFHGGTDYHDYAMVMCCAMYSRTPR